ncbi:MAG TPA: UvrD-helicase domain-containing protein [Solirubrobacteraceae bacterium]|nr:UvrD-helicase domain-containing protein [Solirubrobacteraceae bacterium]
MRVEGRLHVPDDLPLRALSVRRPPQLETLPGMELDVEPPREDGPTFTAEQQQVVTRRAEPLLVSAAAGSGKTSVLVERFVRAVCDDEIAPGRILAITFTERAAGELRERVRARLLELGERQAARDTEAAFVGTFHGFCARLLRAHPLAGELDPDFAVLDEGLAGRLRERAFQEAVRELLSSDRQGRDSAPLDVLAAYGIDRVRAMVEHVYLELRSKGQRFPRLPAPALASDAAADADDAEAAAVCVVLGELLELFGLAYEQRKRARAAVDFDDLELLAQQLLEHHEQVRASWSERFELLMVDEFQDTNPRQLAILRALDRGNLFTVGDEFQSIYGFRHADVGLFRARRAELAERGGSLSLTRNFRSRSALLDVVNAVFAERFAEFRALVAGRPVTAEQSQGEGQSQSLGDGEPAVELLLSDTGGWETREELAAAVAGGLPPAPLWRQAEARMLAQRVSELVASGRARAGDVVVLLRASGDLEVFERALQLCGLRTLAAVGAFWGHQQIGDLLAYLRTLANPLDEEALYGVLASPLGGCSRDCLALLAQAAQASRRSAWDTAQSAAAGESELAQRLSARDLDALAAVCGLIARERAAASRRGVARLIERAIEATRYREHVLALDWGERRLANVHKLLRLARAFEASEGRDLRAFLDHVAYLERAARVEPDAPVEGVEPDAVRLMTVHAAKGLEFPVVCLADLGRQPNARTPDLLLDGERLGVRLMRLDGERSTPALAYDELCAERRAREAEEEDRILYVAMTRARELLLLSGSVDFDRWPRQGPSGTPISWLGPALYAELPELLASREGSLGDLAVGDRGAPVRYRLSSPGAPLLGSLGESAGGRGGDLSDQQRRAAPSDKARGAAAGEARADAGSLVAAEVDSEPRAGASARGAIARMGPSPGVAPEQERIVTLSYSSLTELERCGYRYYLERVLGLGEDRAAARAHDSAEGLEARARGTLVHRLLELLDFARPQPPSAQDVEDCARELGLRVGAPEREELARLIAAACRASLAERVGAARAVRREHPFAFSLAPDEPLVTGVIDLLAVEADGVSLVLDYKSDRVATDVDLEALVEREYAIQRLLYALVILRDGAPAVEIVHWFLERGESVAARYTAGERLVLEQQLAERVARARVEPFAVSPLPHRGLCLTCPGRAGLCSWSEAETLRELP